MDFDFERRSDFSNLLLQTAAREFRDTGLLKIADFYKCYRAFVRGKVESIQAVEPETVEPERYAKHAARYFRLALRYAVADSEPLVLVIMGRVGTGKTSATRQLATELDWPVFSSDEIRKTLAGMPLTQRTPSELRDKVYSPQMTKRTYAKLIEDGLAAIGCSRDHRSRPNITRAGVILDATFSDRKNRDFLREQCAQANTRVQMVELDANLEQIKNRLRARDDNSFRETSDARLEDLEKLNAAYESPSEVAADLIRISATGRVSDTAKAVLVRLADKSARRTDSFVNRQ